jgi:hypothetical protein
VRVLLDPKKAPQRAERKPKQEPETLGMKHPTKTQV